MRFQLRRGLVVAFAATLLVTVAPTSAGARDLLADAQARITAAQVAANKAAAAYDAAQARYYALQDDIGRTRHTIDGMRAEAARLLGIIRQRAIVAYEGGGQPPLGGLLADASDAIEIGRRAVLINTANARNKSAVEQFEATTDDLRAHERTLSRQVDDQARSLSDLQAEQKQLQAHLAAAVREEQQLRADLERQRRAQEYATLLQQAQAAARAESASRSSSTTAPSGVGNGGGAGGNSGGGSGGSGGGTILGHGNWVCPVQGSVSFTDTFGSPRSGGRTHKGTDLFAPVGTPVVAVLSGSVFFQGDPLGGNAAYVNGSDGNTYYYAHLNDYVGGARSVQAGELIGHVGQTGDAAGAPPQLHFEIRIGGPNGTRIDPYPTLAAHC